MPLALSVTYTGALDFYLDGELVHRFGTVGKSKKTEVARNELYPSPRPIVFHAPPNASGSTSRHVIAIRYSRFTMEDPAWAGNQSSIDYMFGFPVHLSEACVSAVRKISIHQMLLTGVGLAFVFLHLILFVFHRPLRANLYFSGLAACSARLAFFTFLTINKDG
ncbi:MAG: hypothetical protein IH820_14100 [Bacteroidetes bacterium]|nr:hypothetical protein [Bacteroidota bacterium]